MITYKTNPEGDIKVYLDGKRAGTIMRVEEGYQYITSTSPKYKGEVFNSLETCKISLETLNRMEEV